MFRTRLALERADQLVGDPAAVEATRLCAHRLAGDNAAQQAGVGGKPAGDDTRLSPGSRYVAMYPIRDEAIAAAYASGGYTLKEIGNRFGLNYAQISRVVRRMRDVKYKIPKYLAS